jgi:death-on-curing family protein
MNPDYQRISKEDIIAINKDLGEGAIIVNQHSLEISVQTANLCPTPEMSAEKMFFGLLTNHPFFDGNKRTGIAAALLILKKNNIQTKENIQEELEKAAIEITKGNITYYQITRLFKNTGAPQ